MKRLFLSALALVLSACTLDDGNPWGEASFELKTRFDRANRCEERLRTSKDFEVQLDEVQLEISTISIGLGQGEVTGFDPANPPKGYSLCHNGHCHAADGRLVDYEDIAAEISGGQVGAELVGAIDQDVSALREEAIPVDCGTCEFERGSLRNATVRVESVRLIGTVTDLRAEPRLADDSPFEISSPPFELSIPLEDLEIGKGSFQYKFSGDLSVSAPILDQIDFAQSTSSIAPEENVELSLSVEAL